MFLWKNAVVIVVLLGIATFVTSMLIREQWERRYVARLVFAAIAISLLTVSAVPMLAAQLCFMLLMLLCFDRRVPMAATYVFFLFWTPAAGSLLKISGAYIAPITAFLSFSGALAIGWLARSDTRLRRSWVTTDVLMLAFITIFTLCMSMRATPTAIARNVVTYFVPYAISYFVLSRSRIPRPELILRWMVFAAAGAGLLCLFETLRSWPLYSGIADVKNDMWIVDAPKTWLMRGGFARAYGPYAHPLVGGAMLGLAAVAGWALWQIRGRSMALTTLSLIILLAIGSTLSRSGFVALAIGLMTFQFLRGRYLLAFLVPLTSVAIIIGAPILSGADARYSTDYRLELLIGVPKALGARMWLGYREAIGEGVLDNFIQGQGIVDLVNSYVGIIVEGGIVSAVAFLLFLLSIYPHYRAIRRSNPKHDQLVLAQALTAILTALIVSLALIPSWAAPMTVSFVAAAILIALRAEVVAAYKAERSAAPLVATLPVDEGERLPALR